MDANALTALSVCAHSSQHAVPRGGVRGDGGGGGGEGDGAAVG